MSYYDVIDATKMTDARTTLLCARLNLRGGKRRLQKGFTVAGVAALYDSILFGMHYYIAKHNRCASLVENIELWDTASLFHVLTRAGVFDDTHAFNRLSLLVERALWQESYLFDTESTLAEVEKMLTKLGVVPFNGPALQRKSIMR